MGSAAAGHVAETLDNVVDWLLDDYHWADVVGVAGVAVAAIGLGVLATAPVAAAILITVGLGLAAVGLLAVANDGRKCKEEGDAEACRSFMIGLVFAALPGVPSWSDVVVNAGLVASDWINDAKHVNGKLVDEK